MKKIKSLLIAALAFTGAYSQKLPNKQETSVRIPSNIKIDGKANEWSNGLQAYNNSTDFSYTIANSNDELYLIVQTKDRFVFNKIIDAGLTPSVTKPGAGKSANVTFPVNDNGTKGVRLSSSFGMGMIIASQKVPEDEIAAYNKILTDRHKFIKVENMEGLDSLVSVYNDNGIRVAEQFDNDKLYTLEMAVSLKLLALSAKDQPKISYKLRVNTVPGAPVIDANSNMVMVDGSELTPQIREQAIVDLNVKMTKMYQGTEFTGEYTLAK